VLITNFVSDEEKDGKTGPLEAGMAGSVWRVGLSNSPGSSAAGAAEITMLRRKLMSTWDTEDGLGVTVQGFYLAGMVYAAGVHEYWTWEINALAADFTDNLAGRGGIYKIDPADLEIEKFFASGAGKPGVYPITADGQILPLNSSTSLAPGEGFRIVGLSNVVFDLMCVGSDLNQASYKNLGSASKKKGEVVDQKMFRIRSSKVKGNAAVAPVFDPYITYVLYHTNKGHFRYRKLNSTTGAPKGAAKKVLKIKKRKLKYMAVAAYDKDVLLAFSEMKNKKNYRINFFSFTVK
jgi:hypothetical protein